MEKRDKTNRETLFETLIEVAERNPDTSELDLHGMDVYEAEYAIGHFLDQEFMAGTTVVKITYGIGTGTLARELPRILKISPHVETFRTGRANGIAAYVVLEKK